MWLVFSMEYNRVILLTVEFKVQVVKAILLALIQLVRKTYNKLQPIGS